MGKAPGIYYYQQDSRLLYLTQPESTSTTSTNHHHQQLPQCLLSVPLNSLPARDHHPAARCRLCPRRLSMEASRLDKHNYAPSTKFIIGLSQLGPTAASRGSAHARQ